MKREEERIEIIFLFLAKMNTQLFFPLCSAFLHSFAFPFSVFLLPSSMFFLFVLFVHLSIHCVAFFFSIFSIFPSPFSTLLFRPRVCNPFVSHRYLTFLSSTDLFFLPGASPFFCTHSPFRFLKPLPCFFVRRCFWVCPHVFSFVLRFFLLANLLASISASIFLSSCDLEFSS